ncbi:hypothetical protein OQA88_1302 [Cercophora sp. LCS_1]
MPAFFLLILGLLASTLAQTPPQTPSLTIAQSCTNITLTGNSFLSATCLTTTNLQAENELDLNLCVGIDYGTLGLTWSVYGKYTVYCGGCALEAKGNPTSHWLTCSCRSIGNPNQAAVTSSLKLDDGMSNRNGTLTCNSWVVQEPGV